MYGKQMGQSVTYDFIINPKSGAVLAAGGPGPVEKKLRSREIFGAAVGQVQPVEGPDIRAAVRQWKAEHAEKDDGHRLVMFAGDGSVLAAAEELLNTDIVLGALPGGTQNFVDNLLGFSPNWEEAAVQLKGKTTVQTMDVGRVNGKIFLYGILLDRGSSALLEAREELRNKKYGKALSKFFDFVAGIGWRKPMDLRVTDDTGATHVMQGRIMTVTNNAIAPHSNKGQGLLLHPTAASLKKFFANTFGKNSEGDGQLAFYAHPGGLRLLAMLPKLWNATYVDDSRLGRRQSATFTIEPVSPGAQTALDVIADGEKMPLQFPLKVEILPRALRLLKPV